MLQFTVELSPKQLRTALQIHNLHKPGESSFDFQTLLHTYYAVPDIASVAVKGLRDAKGQKATYDQVLGCDEGLAVVSPLRKHLLEAIASAFRSHRLTMTNPENSTLLKISSLRAGSWTN